MLAIFLDYRKCILLYVFLVKQYLEGFVPTLVPTLSESYTNVWCFKKKTVKIVKGRKFDI